LTSTENSLNQVPSEHTSCSDNLLPESYVFTTKDKPEDDTISLSTAATATRDFIYSDSVRDARSLEIRKTKEELPRSDFEASSCSAN
jgi:hypothetical protein